MTSEKNEERKKATLRVWKVVDENWVESDAPNTVILLSTGSLTAGFAYQCHIILHQFTSHWAVTHKYAIYGAYRQVTATFSPHTQIPTFDVMFLAED